MLKFRIYSAANAPVRTIGTARTRYLRKLRTPPDNNLVELLGASGHATRYVKNLRSHTLQNTTATACDGGTRPFRFSYSSIQSSTTVCTRGCVSAPEEKGISSGVA